MGRREYYISWCLSACSLGFALSTLSPHYIYIYTLEAHRSFARVCYIHSLSPSSLDLNKTALASVSLSPLTAGEGGVRIPSHREGEEVQRSLYRLRRGRQSTVGYLFSFTQRLCRRATDPFFLTAILSVGRSGLPLHALPHLDDPKV